MSIPERLCQYQANTEMDALSQPLEHWVPNRGVRERMEGVEGVCNYGYKTWHITEVSRQDLQNLKLRGNGPQ